MGIYLKINICTWHKSLNIYSTFYKNVYTHGERIYLAVQKREPGLESTTSLLLGPRSARDGPRCTPGSARWRPGLGEGSCRLRERRADGRPGVGNRPR